MYFLKSRLQQRSELSCTYCGYWLKRSNFLILHPSSSDLCTGSRYDHTNELNINSYSLVSLTYKNRTSHLIWNIVWSPHYVKDKELIEKIQHRFTRMFPELRKLPYLWRLKYLKLWTLEERRACADLIEVYKIIHGISSVSFDTFFEFNSYGTTRGHSLKHMKQRASTNLRHHFFSERVINNCNNLDNKTVTSGSMNIFKWNLKRLGESTEIDLFVGNATWSSEPEPQKLWGVVR